MSNNEWLPEAKQPTTATVVKIDRRPVSERAKLSDRGLVDFRRVRDQVGVLDWETDTIRSATAKN